MRLIEKVLVLHLVGLILVQASSDCDLGDFVLRDVSTKIKVCSKNLSCLVMSLCDCKLKMYNNETGLIEIITLDKLERHSIQKRSIKRRRRQRRRRRNIVTECCIDSCTIDTIMLYCPESAEAVTNSTCEISVGDDAG